MTLAGKDCKISCMKLHLSPHAAAVLQALLVTFLWSTSQILIKIGLHDLPALSFAGLRYFTAFLCLLPVGLRMGAGQEIRHLTRRDWGRLAVLGLVYYGLAQVTVFIGLAYLPAVTISLVLSFTSVLVALLGIVVLGERPGALQWLGTALYLCGAAVYFTPLELPQAARIGLLALGVGWLPIRLLRCWGVRSTGRRVFRH